MGEIAKRKIRPKGKLIYKGIHVKGGVKKSIDKE
jgi:hypothetical protein